MPVLAITGSKDIQVNPSDLKVMAELVESDFEGHEVPDMTHLLRAETGGPTLSTYRRQVQEAVDERVLNIVSEWLRERLRLMQPL